MVTALEFSYSLVNSLTQNRRLANYM